MGSSVKAFFKYLAITAAVMLVLALAIVLFARNPGRAKAFDKKMQEIEKWNEAGSSSQEN